MRLRFRFLRILRFLAVAVLVQAAMAPAWAATESPDQAGFDYYVLALSWAPTFCATHPADHLECGLRRGFVVHGLWPQYEGGGGPEHCSAAETLDREAIERARPAMPDERLIRHEWIVHGTCTGLSPEDYFTTVIHAIGRLSIPSEFDGAAPHTMTSSQVISAFTKANPSMTGRSLALRCRGRQLEEVRVCLSRDLYPHSCGPDIRSRCGSGPLTIGTMH